MTIQGSINNVSKALNAGVATRIIAYCLKQQGYSSQQIKSMIDWAKQMRNNVATYHLHRWSVGDLGDAYSAPEQRRKCLYGHRDSDNKWVRTSPIVTIKGREIHTENSIYILEDIDPEYLKWMDENGFTYDPDNPIKLKGM
jgi:hypothetical protein